MSGCFPTCECSDFFYLFAIQEGIVLDFLDFQGKKMLQLSSEGEVYLQFSGRIYWENLSFDHLPQDLLYTIQ